ncbi:MAG: class I SAM-dependent rRNA methyltransferase, partial [Longimicrobiales bacterium]
FDRRNRFLAAGLWDPESTIRIRVLVHGETERIGRELFRNRLADALGRRTGVASRQTTGFRVLSGGNDGMPGLVADLYDRTLVLKVYSVAWIPHLRHVAGAARDLLAPERILLLASDRVAAGGACPCPVAEGGALHGSTRPGPVPFLETGLRFEARPFEGHKTGFYLDQRANRRRLGAKASGARVLDVFAHSGGFSLHAARGGAREVVSVDVAGPALQQARRHFDLNRSDPRVRHCRHATIEGDAFAVMTELVRREEEFDFVVVDPPAFARASRHRSNALTAYGKLTSLATSLLRPGGLLVQASCSSRIGAEEFQDVVVRSARAEGWPLDEVEITGHPPDHPVGFPQGRYLKCVWGRLS